MNGKKNVVQMFSATYSFIVENLYSLIVPESALKLPACKEPRFGGRLCQAVTFRLIEDQSS